MKSKFKKNLIAAASVLALSCVAVGGVLSLNTSDGLVDTTAKKAASLVAAAESTTPTSNGNTYYVSASVAYDATYATSMGSGTASDPYNFTYLFESDILAAGDTVAVIPGTYTITKSITINISGTYDNYITITNAAALDSTTYSGNAVLTFYDLLFDSNNRGVQINGDYIYWYDIDICGAGDNGMYVAGDYNIIENSEFYNNRDTGFQLGRAYSDYDNIEQWPSYNLIKNCSSYNNYDNETYGENADGFAAKLTVGYGNIFDGCIAYRNSDDGWDLYAKADSGNIGCVIIYNCVAYENGYLMETQAVNNARFTNFRTTYAEENSDTLYTTRDGDGNGFKLGGGSNEGDVILYNCMAFNNRMHGVTDNSNPGTLMLSHVTSYNNGVNIDSSTGDISYSTKPSEDCANIDVARWDYSYNTLSNILSVTGDGAETDPDAYRGSTEYSMFTSTYVTTNIDAYDEDDNKCGTAYDSTYAAPTKSVFKATPEVTMGTISEGTYNSETCQYSNTAHLTYRNSDGSINMGDILAVDSYDGLVSTSVGCTLNKSSYSEYTHYDYTLLSTCSSEGEAKATAMEHLIYVPVNVDACYQDFKVVATMFGSDITWTSSDTSVLSIATTTESTISSSESYYVTVNRDASADKTVTLTATFEISGETRTKTFTIVVKQDDPTIGEITVDDVDDGGVLIVDQYTMYPEPGITVTNGSDYSGKLLDDSLYTIESTYIYATSGDASAYTYQTGMFTPSRAGMYTITKTVTINGADATDSTKTGSYTYTIYVASTTAEITLSNTSVTVNRDGFILEASPSNVTGYLYVLVLDADATAPTTADEIIANENSIATEFRTDAISLQYSNANSAGYKVYVAVSDLAKENTSDVYTLEVGTSEISTTSQFEGMLSSTSTSTIYLLTADIDYSNGSIGTSETSFSGLFNGMGYTVKNATTTQYIFYKVVNGTIMNVKFDNIAITSSTNKTGIISEMDGGYIYNVAMTNISIDGGSSVERIGALVGQIATSGATHSVTYIQNVSLINEDSYTIVGKGRIGGIVGFYQDNGSQAGSAEIYISDCYVDATLTVKDTAVGGIFGRFDDRNANDYLSIINCVTTGTYTSEGTSSRIGGILGYHSGGNGTLYIDTCVSIADIFFGEILTAALKNASGIVGGYSTAATVTVTNCCALFTDYNDEYDVSATTLTSLNSERLWSNIGFDFSGAWSLALDTTAPYVVLNFIEVE